MFTLMNSLGRESTETDTRAMLAYVDALPAADPPASVRWAIA
jgi:hypothetical protein